MSKNDSTNYVFAICPTHGRCLHEVNALGEKVCLKCKFRSRLLEIFGDDIPSEFAKSLTFKKVQIQQTLQIVSSELKMVASGKQRELKSLTFARAICTKDGYVHVTENTNPPIHHVHTKIGYIRWLTAIGVKFEPPNMGECNCQMKSGEIKLQYYTLYVREYA